MLKNCPVACKECDNKCADHEPFCNEWKKNKECTRNPEYMNIYCARSCGKCKVGEAIKEFWGFKVTFKQKFYPDFIVVITCWVVGVSC